MSGRYRKLTDSSGTTIWPVTTTSAIIEKDSRLPLDHFLREFNLCSIWPDSIFDNLSSALETLVGQNITFQKGDRVVFDDSTEICTYEFNGTAWIKKPSSETDIIDSTDKVLPGDARLVTSGGVYVEINRIESISEIALSDLEKKHQKNVKRIEDLEDGYEATYDDIERIENKIRTEFDEVKEKLKFDETPTENSTNAISSGGVYVAVTNLSQVIEDNEEVTAAALVDLDKRLKDSNGVAADIQDHLNVVEEVTEKSLIDLNSKIEKINSLTYSDIDNIV